MSRLFADVDEESDEAALELRSCTEPGHYLRGASAFSVDSETSNWTFEFQLILTEDELKSLKVTFSVPIEVYESDDY